MTTSMQSRRRCQDAALADLSFITNGRTVVEDGRGSLWFRRNVAAAKNPRDLLNLLRAVATGKRVHKKVGKAMPACVGDRLAAVEIIFLAGYGPPVRT
jgi:hypothetical protein